MPEEIICPECSRVVISIDGVCTHGQTQDAPAEVAPVEETVAAEAPVDAPADVPVDTVADVPAEPAVEASDETSVA